MADKQAIGVGARVRVAGGGDQGGGVTQSTWATAVLAVLCAAFFPALLSAQAAAPASYFEFGTVVALGRGTIELQTYDETRGRTVQHSFVLSKDSRADVVHAGDQVEVIYTATTADWVIRRLVVLTAGIPRAGRPPGGDVAVSQLPAAQPTSGGSTAKVPGQSKVAIPGQAAGRGGKAVPQVGAVNLPSGAAKAATAGSAYGVALGGNTAARGVGGVASVDLGGTPRPRAPEAIDVPMGGVADPRSATPPPIRAREIAQQKPSEECNRSDADWPNQPLRIAVLDFRYPTEREEAHDVGTTGGGSGTALADIVFDRLSQINDFAWSRGDRSKLYRADFAGAARLGRQLGVDAVLAGTFQPVQLPPDQDGIVPPVKTYELRAGLVDTCTGQLLMRLSSAVCPGGVDLGGTSSGCTRYAVTTRQASDPKDSQAAFKPALDALLIPLEHQGTPSGLKGGTGSVSGVQSSDGATRVTIRLEPGANVKAGDLVALHGWRLTKNPTTYTLHLLKDEEIGRVTITQVSGGIATGMYQGDFFPKAGDLGELVTQ